MPGKRERKKKRIIKHRLAQGGIHVARIVFLFVVLRFQ